MSASTRLESITEQASEILPLHKIKIGTTNPYSKTTRHSVCSMKDHFSVLQQHRGQQRLPLATIVALSYLPVSFGFALSPQGSSERNNGHGGDFSVKETDLSRRLRSPSPLSAKQPPARGFGAIKTTEGLSSVSYARQFLSI